MPTQILADKRADKAVLIDKKVLIESDRTKFADDKIFELGGWITKLPHRKAKKGNMTMRDYLISLKLEVEKDKIGYAQKILDQLDVEIARDEATAQMEITNVG